MLLAAPAGKAALACVPLRLNANEADAKARLATPTPRRFFRHDRQAGGLYLSEAAAGLRLQSLHQFIGHSNLPLRKWRSLMATDPPLNKAIETPVTRTMQ